MALDMVDMIDARISRRAALGGALTATLGAATASVVADAAHATPIPGSTTPTTRAATAPVIHSLADTIKQFRGQKPHYWGFYGPGVHSTFPTTGAGRDAVALSFDACGGTTLRYDAALIATLRRLEVPATLFINRRWATHNPSIMRDLLRDPLFDIQNHGDRHLPLSVTGRSAYGIKGTANLTEVWYETLSCHAYLHTTWKHDTRFLRVGTCYTDDVAARAARYAGQELVSFAVNGDAGATFPAKVVTQQLLTARPGDIVISHMNHPGSGTNPGYARALPAMKAAGLRFVHLKDVIPG